MKMFTSSVLRTTLLSFALVLLDSEIVFSTITLDDAKLLTTLVFLDSVDKSTDQNVTAMFSPSANQCVVDLIYLLESLTQLKANGSPNYDWTLSLLDSIGKPQSGILGGQLLWTGDFNECKRVRASDRGFSGRYCLTVWKLDSSDASPIGPPGLRQGICVPDSCSSEDVWNNIEMYKQVLEHLPYSKDFLSQTNGLQLVKCDQPLPLNINALTCIAVMILLVLLAVASTVADIVLEERHEAEKVLSGVNCDIMKNNQQVVNNKSVKQSENAVVSSMQRKRVHGYIKCFSLKANGERLFKTDGFGKLDCIQGLRVINIVWVVVGHSAFFTWGYSSNLIELTKAEPNPLFHLVLNSTFSVDTFLIISGFLICYQFMVSKEDKTDKFNLVMFYLNRYLRLTPLLAFTIWVYVALVPYFGSSPFWDNGHSDDQFSAIGRCARNWWTNLLYINNFLPMGKQCMLWTWYLAIDSQFYIISPLFLFAFKRSSKFGTILAVTVVTLVSLALFFTANDLRMSGIPGYGLAENATFSSDFKKIARTFDTLYIKPWCRIGPCLMGLVTAYAYFRSQKEDWSKWWSPVKVNIMSTLAIVFTFISVYATFNVHLSDFSIAIYVAFSRPMWAFAICWILFAAPNGLLPDFNKILTWKPLIPLGRLTYAVYLFHPIFITAVYANLKTPFIFDNMLIAILAIGFVAISYLLGLIFTLLVEMPINQMMKCIFRQ